MTANKILIDKYNVRLEVGDTIVQLNIETKNVKVTKTENKTEDKYQEQGTEKLTISYCIDEKQYLSNLF